MRNNKTNDIPISIDAMEETIAACQIELKTITACRPSKTELLLRFIRMELHGFLRLSLGGLLLCICGSLLFPGESFILTLCYLIVLSAAMLFELYRRRYYHMEELLAPLYLNNGRVFILKIAGITLLELLECLLLGSIVFILDQGQFFLVMLYGILPLFLTQLLLVTMLDFMQSLSKAVAVYTILFGVYEFLIKTWRLMQYVTLVQVSVCIGCLILLLYVQAALIYQKKKRREQRCSLF